MAPLEPLERRLQRGLAIALVLTTLGSLGLLVFGGGLGAVGPALGSVPPRALLFCLAALGLEWALDAVRFAVVARVVGVEAPATFWLRLALVYLAAAYGANLGPLACAWMLGRRGVAAGPAFAIAFGKQALYLPAVLVPTWLLSTWAQLAEGAVSSAMRGVGLLSLAIAGAVGVVVLWPRLARRAFEWSSRHRQHAAVDGFSAALRRFFLERPGALALSLLLAVANHVAAVAALVALLSGFGVRALDAGVWIRTLIFVTLGQSSPTPGGAGVSELAGVLLLRPLLSQSALAGFLVLGRFLAIQLPILLGAALVFNELRPPASGAPRSVGR